MSEPVNCPVCKEKPGVDPCSPYLYPLCDCFSTELSITVEEWNKAFGPKEIDWKEEEKKFNSWISIYLSELGRESLVKNLYFSLRDAWMTSLSLAGVRFKNISGDKDE